MVVTEVGQERWETLLMHLAEVEERTGQVLRRLPRGTERQGRKHVETCPLLLFAPDRDQERREFGFIEGGALFYSDGSSHKESWYKYPIFSQDDAEWWQRLTAGKKGVVISVLGYILGVLGKDGSILEFIKKTMEEK